MTLEILRITEDWPLPLKVKVDAYFAAQRIDLRNVLRVDLVLALLRIGDKDCLERVQELTGKPITRCPSAVPPWPPKPPAKRPSRALRVTKIGDAPAASTGMHDRFRQVRLGMTQEQMIARGVTVRDIRYWKKTGRIELGYGETGA